MKKLMISFGGAALVALALAATAMAAGPMTGQGQGQRAAGGSTGTEIPALLGLTADQVQELRQTGLSLAQIAEREDVDPQVLVDALMSRWTVRIDARVAAGALTADEAVALKAQVELRARDMVYKVTLGGMQGQAVGGGQMNGQADRGNGNGNGNAAGNGLRDGSGAGNGGRGAGNGACDGTGTGAGQS